MGRGGELELGLGEGWMRMITATEARRRGGSCGGNFGGGRGWVEISRRRGRREGVIRELGGGGEEGGAEDGIGMVCMVLFCGCYIRRCAWG